VTLPYRNRSTPKARMRQADITSEDDRTVLHDSCFSASLSSPVGAHGIVLGSWDSEARAKLASLSESRTTFLGPSLGQPFSVRAFPRLPRIQARPETRGLAV